MRRHSREDYGVRRHSCFIISFSYVLSHRNHHTVKWGPSEQSQMTDVMLNQNPMSSSEDNESKSYPELDESALLVAQLKLLCVFEIRPLDTCRFLSDAGSFRTYHVGLPPGYK